MEKDEKYYLKVYIIMYFVHQLMVHGESGADMDNAVTHVKVGQALEGVNATNLPRLIMDYLALDYHIKQ